MGMHPSKVRVIQPLDRRHLTLGGRDRRYDGSHIRCVPDSAQGFCYSTAYSDLGPQVPARYRGGTALQIV